MSSTLKLEVILAGIDKASGPFKRVAEKSKALRDSLKNSKEALKELERTQDNIGGFQKLKKELGGTEGTLKKTQQRIRELTQAQKANGGESKTHAAVIAKLKKEAASLKTTSEQQRGKLHELRTTLKGAGIDTRQMADHQVKLKRRIADASKDIDLQKTKLDQLGKAQQRMHAAKANAEKWHRGGMVAGGHGMMAMMAGRRALSAGGAALAPGMEFEQAMSHTQAVAKLDKNSPQMQALREQAKELGRTTAFSGADVAAAQGFLAMAGYTPEAIQAAIPAVLNTALAGNMELGQAADIISNISGAMGFDPSETGKVADVLSATMTSANVDLNMLGQTMKYVGPQARAMGIDLETAAGMAGLLGNIGIQADMAGTTMREVLNRMASPPKAAADALEKLKIKTVDSAGNLRPVLDIIRDVGEASKNMGTGERGGMFSDIFGARAGAGMADLVTREGTGELRRYVESLRDVEGTAARVAGIKADNLLGDAKGLKSAIEGISIAINEALGPSLRAGTQWMTGIAQRVGAWINANPALAATLGKVALAGAVLTTVLGGLLMAGGMAAMMFSQIYKAAVLLAGGKGLGALAGSGSMAAKPFIAIGTAIRSLPGAIWAAAKAISIGLMGALKSSVVMLVSTLKWLWRFPTTLLAAFKSIPGLLLAVAKGIGPALMGGLKGIGVLLAGGLKAALVGISALFSPVVLGIAAVAAAALLIWKYWQPIKAFLIGVWDGFMVAMQPVMDALGVAFEPLRPMFDWLGEAFGSVVKWVKELLTPMDATNAQLATAASWGLRVGQVIGGMLVGSFKALGTIIKVVIAVFAGAWDVLKFLFNYSPLGLIINNWGAISPYLSALWVGIKATTGTLWDWIKTAFNYSPLGLIINNWGAISGYLGGLWDNIKAYVGAAWDYVTGLFSGDREKVIGGLQGMWTAINNILGGWPAKMLQAGLDMVQGFINGIRNNFGGVGKAIAGLGDTAIVGLKSILGIKSPSRVFARLGDDTMAGLTLGLDRSGDAPLASIHTLGQRMRAAGAGMALAGAMAGPAVALDARPPLATSGTAGGAGGNTYQIHITVTGGAAASDIGQAVRAEIERLERERSARHRSRLAD